MTTPSPSELDLYIIDIVEKLRAKYGYSDKNRMRSTVRFYYNKYTYGQWIMMGGKQADNRKEVIEIPYTELKECMENKTLPKEIQKLL